MEACLHFANANIAPAEEYEHRLRTARGYAEALDIPFIEGEYEPQRWAEAVGTLTEEERTSSDGTTPPPERCRACYRMRFRMSAAYAAEHGFNALGTTLSVSPYQYTDIIREELEQACAEAGINAFFEDYSPLYPETVRTSQEEGLYRQDYCGCLPSKAEADAGRAIRKAEREARKAERAQARQAEEAAREERRREQATYDAKQAKKKAIRRALRTHEDR